MASEAIPAELLERATRPFGSESKVRLWLQRPPPSSASPSRGRPHGPGLGESLRCAEADRVWCLRVRPDGLRWDREDPQSWTARSPSSGHRRDGTRLDRTTGCACDGFGVTLGRAEPRTAHPELRMWKTRRCDEGGTAPIAGFSVRSPPAAVRRRRSPPTDPLNRIPNPEVAGSNPAGVTGVTPTNAGSSGIRPRGPSGDSGVRPSARTGSSAGRACFAASVKEMPDHDPPPTPDPPGPSAGIRGEDRAMPGPRRSGVPGATCGASRRDVSRRIRTRPDKG